MTKKPLIAITGASSGIGEATARAFSAAGHPLLLMARRLDRLEALGLPDAVLAKVDVRDREAIARAVAEAEAKFGPVDMMFANAGIARLGDIAKQQPEEWDEMIDINTKGVLNSVHPVMGGMIERKSGTIVMMSSIAGRKVYPHHDVYGGTKHFVHAVSEGMRQTMSAYRVRVMVISPGVAKSEIDKTITHQNAYEFWDGGRKALDGGLDANDIARTMLFAYELPQNVNLQEMTITHTGQEF